MTARNLTFLLILLILLAAPLFAAQGKSPDPPPFPGQPGPEQAAWLEKHSRTGVDGGVYTNSGHWHFVPFQGPGVRYANLFWFDTSTCDEKAFLAYIMQKPAYAYRMPAEKTGRTKKGGAPAEDQLITQSYEEKATSETWATAAPRFSLAIRNGGRAVWVTHLLTPTAQTLMITATPPEGKHEMRWTLDGKMLPVKAAAVPVPVQPGLHVLVGFATYRDPAEKTPFLWGLDVQGEGLMQLISVHEQKAAYARYERLQAKPEAKPEAKP